MKNRIYNRIHNKVYKRIIVISPELELYEQLMKHISGKARVQILDYVRSPIDVVVRSQVKEKVIDLMWDEYCPPKSS